MNQIIKIGRNSSESHFEKNTSNMPKFWQKIEGYLEYQFWVPRNTILGTQSITNIILIITRQKEILAKFVE